MSSHGARLLVLWLLGSVLLAALLYAGSERALRTAVAEQVRQHLLLTLDEAYFGSAGSRGNDREALARIGEQINVALGDLVTPGPLAARRECRVRLLRLEDVELAGGDGGGHIDFSLPRNQVERQVRLGLDCGYNPWAAVAAAALLGVLFALIARLVPPPLSRVHRHWINQLLGDGYSGAEAFEIVSAWDAASLALNDSQQACLERLHDPGRGNFAAALAVAADRRVAALDPVATEWLVLWLAREPGDLEGALALATGEDTVDIDLERMTLKLRTLAVPMGGTPLFYYAWYALQRLQGEGWVTNPASNRPDLAVGGEIAELMGRFDGHGRAINDLQQSGLKARTLDQNRSKIKDEIVAVLGESLSEPFLFEASRHPDGVNMRYRLRLEGQFVRVRQ